MFDGRRRQNDPGVPICFLGSSRYGPKWDPSLVRKFELLGDLGPIYVVAFSGARPASLAINNARFYLLPCPRLRFLRGLLFASGAPIVVLWCVLYRHCQVIVAQGSREGLLAMLACWILRLVGRRVGMIVEQHGRPERLTVGDDWVDRAVETLAERAIKRADALRAVSGSTEAYLRSIAPDKPIARFPAWTDLASFLAQQRPADFAEEVLFVGRVTPVKGVQHLVSAFAMVAAVRPASTLAIIGNCDDCYRKRLEDLITEHGLGERVRFSKPLPQQGLAARMARAAVLALPSVASAEGQPRVVLEAMAVGLPVVASRSGGIPEQVVDGQTGILVAPGDAHALADALIRALARRGESAAMGAAGRSRALQLFSTEGYVEGYRSLIAAALAARGAR